MSPEWAHKHIDKETDRLHGPELMGSALTQTDKTDETKKQHPNIKLS